MDKPNANKEKRVYDPTAIEPKWQAKWSSERLYQPDLQNAKKPYYNLMMFPYPSAEGMHVGNMYAQTGGDIYGRFQRMRGNDVFQPMGLDGFGIHSENYALKVGSHPMDQADKSEANFYRQMKETGSGFAWENTVETWKPNFYAWTQWLFTQLFKAGLAYRENVPVNYCPSCKTVLADEQVIDGRCERCGTTVEKRDLEQWMFRITEYAEQLLEGLDRIDWTEKVKIAQRNWIGKSEGATLKFRVSGTNIDLGVFTTRPDTLYGATFLVVSPEHPAVAHWLDNPGVREYVEQAREEALKKDRTEDKDKTGVFSGAYALNLVSNEQMPIWIADYVLMSYGTGAIMAVPAHDERDFDFAKKYDLPIRHVIMPSFIDKGNPPQEGKEHTKRTVILAIVRDPQTQKYLILDWKEQGWKTFVTGGVENGEDVVEAARREIKEETGYSDLAFVRELGGPTQAFFYAAHKGVNRQTKAHVLLFDLASDTREEVAAVERKQHEVTWLAADEVVQAQLRHGEFDVIWERLQTGKDVYTGNGVLINSGDWDGWEMPEAKAKVINYLEDKGIGQGYTNYHLRDWLISRQRYWGPPIPMVYCQTCAEKGKSWFTTEEGKAQPTLFKHLDKVIDRMAGWYPEEHLPVLLPRIEDYKPLGTPSSDSGQASSPLGNHPDFYETTCPACGSSARRETDVSDTFLDSSWYFFRYLSPNDTQAPWTPEFGKKWLPVTIYTGGAEHSVLHLLYTRFLTKVIHDLKLIDFDEPFPRFYAHGLIIKDGAKMSKSKGNVIVPDQYIKKFGADTLRSYLMFLGPFNMGGDFRDSGIEGMNRFIKRVWTLVTTQPIVSTEIELSAKSDMHKTIKGVTDDIEAFRYNTAIAKIMSYYNILSKKEALHKEEAKVLVQLLAPFAPHMTEELWEFLGEPFSIHTSAWPVFDPFAVSESAVVIAVQINGKLRTTLTIPAEQAATQGDIEQLAKEDEAVARHLEGKTIRKVIYVPGKILNYVVS